MSRLFRRGALALPSHPFAGPLFPLVPVFAWMGAYPGGGATPVAALLSLCAIAAVAFVTVKAFQRFTEMDRALRHALVLLGRVEGHIETRADGSRDVEPASPPRPLSILLVEDDDDLREVLGEILTAAGYRVLSAADAGTALQTAAEPETLDIVLTDIIMPRMNGIDLALHILRERPAVKVLLMSGSLDQALVGRVTSAGFAMVRKPFTPTVLRAALQQLVGAEPA